MQHLSVGSTLLRRWVCWEMHLPTKRTLRFWVLEPNACLWEIVQSSFRILWQEHLWHPNEYVQPPKPVRARSVLTEKRCVSRARHLLPMEKSFLVSIPCTRLVSTRAFPKNDRSHPQSNPRGQASCVANEMVSETWLEGSCPLGCAPALSIPDLPTFLLRTSASSSNATLGARVVWENRWFLLSTFFIETSDVEGGTQHVAYGRSKPTPKTRSEGFLSRAEA